ncbi:hypothetical protein MCUN1_003545 [Malassezia cuniculi]|uniref:CCD97-like C-terminal domain-containing protein n=1 Tax=Malassezia cuniculi TaxID=948313 RepID=A0AAF0J7W8_9BASI|nr:hypothetical protein MCUN1_003545 [Malassezia cuniculi]
MSDREWAPVQQWLADMHADKEQSARDIFMRYLEQLPAPLDRIVGEQLSPQERAEHPVIRARRRKYVESGTAEDLDIDTQRRRDPALWDRIVGVPRNYQDEEEEESGASDELAEVANNSARVRPANGPITGADSAPQSAMRQSVPADTPQTAPADTPQSVPADTPQSALADTPLSTQGPLGALHRRYLAEIDGNALDGYYAPELLAEFGRAVRDRSVQGMLEASYACDYDEQWDSCARETDESWFDE